MNLVEKLFNKVICDNKSKLNQNNNKQIKIKQINKIKNTKVMEKWDKNNTYPKSGEGTTKYSIEKINHQFEYNVACTFHDPKAFSNTEEHKMNEVYNEHSDFLPKYVADTIYNFLEQLKE